jgi:membrane protease subunit HflC
MRPIHILLIIIIGIATAIGANSAFIVKETDQAMVLAIGKVDRVVTEPGLHFKVPFYQQVIFFDKRTLETDSSPEEVQAKDKKRVVVDSFTRWRISEPKKFYEAVRTIRSARDRLDLIVNSNIRQTLAQETLQDIVSGERHSVMQEIKRASTIEAAPLGIEVVDVRIKRADLPQNNSLAIFGRMRTEREKEAKELRAGGSEQAQKIRASAQKDRTILLAEAKRDGEKTRGQGDAESIRITAEAFSKGPEFYRFYRSLEAYRNSLAGGDTLLVMDPSIDFLKGFHKKNIAK